MKRKCSTENEKRNKIITIQKRENYYDPKDRDRRTVNRKTTTPKEKTTKKKTNKKMKEM